MKHTILTFFACLPLVLIFSACQSPILSPECAPNEVLQNQVCVPKEKNLKPVPSKPAPQVESLYIRGGFNGWGAGDGFKKVKPGLYQTTIEVAPGNHEFKLASKDWNTVWTIQGQKDSTVVLGKTYTLVPDNQGIFLFVRQHGTFQFSLDISQTKKPRFNVVQVTLPGSAALDPHKHHDTVESRAYSTWDEAEEIVRFSVDDPEKLRREYAQSTSQTLRDPGPSYRFYKELPGYPRSRTGSLQFDALFALGINEMQMNSVTSIRDDQYNEGEPLPCRCFKTGEKWDYVWTRDTAYAADLALAMFDPLRTRNSLLFKLSGYRASIQAAPYIPGAQDGFQIVQDTGSGGSWPISTDRVSWAFGAERVLANLPSDERKAFAKQSYRALVNTLEIDRVAAFDGTDGLYNGEQSFLDWREQSYAPWITDDIAALGSTKALSTNVAHYQALKLASVLAQELGDRVAGVKYEDWALDLKKAINQRFWQPERGLYSSMTAPYPDGASLSQYDWLGTSLAIVSGVADTEKAVLALENYPHGPFGAPVIFPQQPGIPIYHNRALWPFVTAYGLRAAIAVGNAEVANEAYKTLIRSASLNMSNMENLEWLSGQPLLLDEQNPGLSGPVINSKRQLWSVAAYLAMVTEGVFGVSMSEQGVSFSPFVTSYLRREYFADSNVLELKGLKLRDKRLDLKVVLPAISYAQGVYELGSVRVNGERIQGKVGWNKLKPENEVVIYLTGLKQSGAKITRVAGDPYATSDSALYAPKVPFVESARLEQQIPQFELAAPESGLALTLHKNGQQVRSQQMSTHFSDPSFSQQSGGCYTFSAVFTATQNASHHSPAHCFNPVDEVSMDDSRVTSNLGLSWTDDPGSIPFLKDWGRQTDSLKVEKLRIRASGRYAFQIKYANTYNTVNLGITNAVKWLTLVDESGQQVAAGVVQMPHTAGSDADKWRYSSPFLANLLDGEYTLSIQDFVNMSYLESNATYSDNGGHAGPINRADISAVKVSQLGRF